MSTDPLLEELAAIVGDARIAIAPDLNLDELHDEALGVVPGSPRCVVHPTTTEEVRGIVRTCALRGVAVVARGSGTGLSGGATALDGCVLVAFSRMNAVLEIDTNNHTATVQPGVTLRELATALEGTGLHYPIHPGELSGSIGGNVSTNAGGMRAVRDGVTRHHILGLEVVLADGSSLRTGGKVTKSATGYDLTQLIVGSQGTLALVTEITLKLSVAPRHAATLLAPFADLASITDAIPQLIETGLDPAILEYLDLLTMASITAAAELDLGIPDDISARALAYLVVVLEDTDEGRVASDVEAMGNALESRGAMDIFLLPPSAGARLIEARERAFYVAKANGATDIIDIVVPRAAISEFLSQVAAIASERGAFVAGCGHAGDGNVHLSVFETDDAARHELLTALFKTGISLGGQISGEHGIGTAKLAAYEELTDPTRLDLERRIKEIFDPHSLFNPHLSPRRRPTS